MRFGTAVSIERAIEAVGPSGGPCTIRGTVEELCLGERLDDNTVARVVERATRSVRFGVRDETGLAIVDDDWLHVTDAERSAVCPGDIVTVSGSARSASAGDARSTREKALVFDGGPTGAVNVTVESRATRLTRR